MFNVEFNDSFKAINLELKQELRDTYNRLHSIAHDAAFIDSTVRPAFPLYPVIPNLRCGSWYCQSTTDTAHAYFKSTDGHTNEHNFVLRRSNLALIPLISSRDGLVIVDSTRRGKRFPDALSKTIPIWCAVLNCARAKLRNEIVDEDGKLWTLPTAVSRSEHAQIDAKVGEWAESLLISSYDLSALASLTLPLRPIFVSPSSTFAPPSVSQDLPYHPIICVSASELATDISTREHGFAYVQGAGDDHETWSKGLTPALFWKYNERLLGARRDEVDAVITSVLELEKHALPLLEESGGARAGRVSVRNTRIYFRFAAGEQIDDPRTIRIDVVTVGGFAIVISSDKGVKMVARSGKAGHSDFFNQVAKAVDFAAAILSKEDDGVNIIVGKSENQKDANDLGIALILILLTRFYNDAGLLCTMQEGQLPTKALIRDRLNWILESFPTLNPSRTILNRLNRYLISSGQ